MDKKWYLAGNLPDDAIAPVRFNLGSTAIKAAWRILTEQATHRRSVPAITWCRGAAGLRRCGRGKCTTRDIALVGLHIVSKTPGRPQWVWSSFEHVDNVPGRTTEPKPPAGVPYSFHDPNEPATLSPESGRRRPSSAGQPNPISRSGADAGGPHASQIARAGDGGEPEPIGADAKIKGTVWENYMLVMTQWPTSVSPESPGNDANPIAQRHRTRSATPQWKPISKPMASAA